jgi:uncharacterized membrane protein YbhN (UPF0104 family)
MMKTTDLSGRIKNFLKGFAGFFGAVLSILGVWYLFNFVAQVDVSAYLSAMDAAQFSALVGLTVGLALANTLIPISWRAILSDFGGELPSGNAQLIFSRSNLGKYVPGNVLHMVGRQMLSMREGLSAYTVAKSLSVEILLLVLTSGCIAGAVGLVSRFAAFDIAYASLTVGLTIGGGVLLLRRLGFAGCANAMLGHLSYHLIGGMVFSLLFIVLGYPSIVESNFGLLVMAYVASWVLGLLTPGAPAGLGVREAALIALLQGKVIDHSVLGAAVLLARFMSIMGDFIYFSVLEIWSSIVSHERRSV